MHTLCSQLDSRWPHRWAVALVCATFPLIWVGGLVTTYDAGMAVPDWPNTYGYNLFAYPWQTWLYGPWGLFIEHGHRLLGSLVGMIAIGLLIASWTSGARRSVKWLSVATLVAVIAQGVLGGMRVIEDEVLLARVHGCFGPAFFALAVTMAVVTSERWQLAPSTAASETSRPSLARVERYAVLTTLLAYVQLVLGAHLRHLPAGARPGDFQTALVFHLVVAVALLVHVALLAWEVLRSQRGQKWLLRPTIGLALLLLVQLGLGAGTWVLKYGWPAWFADFGFAASYTVSAASRTQAWITTAHVATGSLILVTSLLVALRAVRFAWRGSRGGAQRAYLLEAAL